MWNKSKSQENVNQVNKTIAQKIVAEIRVELNLVWFAAIEEKDAKKKSRLLEEYRALKRSYEAQSLLSA